MKRMLILVCIPMFFYAGCVHLPKPVGVLDKSQVIEKYLTNRDLDLIEGIWVWDDGLYEIAIISNSFGIYPQYDYIGFTTDTKSFGWEKGETKLLLKKTASRSVYSATYFMGDKSEVGTTALLTSENLLEMMLPTGPYFFREKTLLIRAYPQDDSYTKSLDKDKTIKKTGTGFAISEDGLIVTAYHIIQNAKLIKVYLAENSFTSAKVVRSDPVNDLAVLKIETSTPNFLHFAPMRSVHTGDRVFTIGFPVSTVLGQEAKYTEGVVSSLSGIEGASSFLQITVPVQPGNSGGPLVNEKGEVVGIITSTVAILPFIEKSGTLPQNINWAVKADYLKPLIELPSVEQKELSREQLITHVKKATFFIESE